MDKGVIDKSLILLYIYIVSKYFVCIGNKNMEFERTYRLYDRVTKSFCFREFSSFIDLWRSKSTSNKFPSWGEYDFEDFGNWYGRLSLGEIINPEKMQMILWGTQLTEWWGADYTKKEPGFLGEAYKNCWFESEIKYLQTMFENRSIGVWQGNLTHLKREFINIRCIDLPLEQDNKITHLLSAYIKVSADTETNIFAEPTHTYTFSSQF